MEYKLYIAVAVDSKRYVAVSTKRGKLAPGAYAGIIKGADKERSIWGQGYVSNSEALFAYGICHILDEALIDFPGEISDGTEAFSVEAIANNIGAGRYLKEYVPHWLANKDRGPDNEIPNNFEVWKRTYLLSSLGKLSLRKAIGPEGRLVKAMAVAANEKKGQMADCPANTHEGLVSTSADQLSNAVG